MPHARSARAAPTLSCGDTLVTAAATAPSRRWASVEPDPATYRTRVWSTLR